jgi:hypothetical protein
MRAILAVSLLALAIPAAAADIYRWVDEKGTVHYSNGSPPSGVKATKIDVDTEPVRVAPDNAECYTVRCQGERLEQRLALREQAEARLAAERAAAMPRPPKGLDFRKYVSLRRGMSEGEFLSIAGEPDLMVWDAFAVRTYTYFATPADPFISTITLVNGRVAQIERERKF